MTLDIRKVVDEIPTTPSPAPASTNVEANEDEDEGEQFGQIMDVALNNDSQSIHASILRYGALHLLYGESDEAALDILAAHLEQNPIADGNGPNAEEDDGEPEEED